MSSLASLQSVLCREIQMFHWTLQDIQHSSPWHLSQSSTISLFMVDLAIILHCCSPPFIPWGFLLDTLWILEKKMLLELVVSGANLQTLQTLKPIVSIPAQKEVFAFQLKEGSKYNTENHSGNCNWVCPSLCQCRMADIAFHYIIHYVHLYVMFKPRFPSENWLPCFQ